MLKEVTVRTEKTVLGESSVTEVGADVEGLTVGFRVGVVARSRLTVTHETCVGRESEDGIVLPWNIKCIAMWKDQLHLSF